MRPPSPQQVNTVGVIPTVGDTAGVEDASIVGEGEEIAVGDTGSREGVTSEGGDGPEQALPTNRRPNPTINAA